MVRTNVLGKDFDLAWGGQIKGAWLERAGTVAHRKSGDPR